MFKKIKKLANSLVMRFVSSIRQVYFFPLTIFFLAGPNSTCFTLLPKVNVLIVSARLLWAGLSARNSAACNGRKTKLSTEKHDFTKD